MNVRARLKKALLSFSVIPILVYFLLTYPNKKQAQQRTEELIKANEGRISVKLLAVMVLGLSVLLALALGYQNLIQMLIKYLSFTLSLILP